jgi:hypothetical protein
MLMMMTMTRLVALLLILLPTGAAFAQEVGDTFTDTDGTALSSHTASGTGGGGAWTNVAGTAGIYGNKVMWVSGDPAAFRLSSTLADGNAPFCITMGSDVPNSSTFYELMARYDAAANTAYVLKFRNTTSNGSNWRIFKRSAGTDTPLSSAKTHTVFAASDTICLEATGTSTVALVATRNGAWVDETTDSTSPLAGTQIGIGFSGIHAVSTGSGTITSLTSSGTTATAARNNHGLQVGDYTIVVGAAQSEYNGTFQVTAINTVADPDTFSYTMGSDPAVDTATGTITNRMAILRSGATATVYLVGHGHSTGQYVDIAGADQAEYNGRFLITVTNSRVFTYTVSGTPASPATGSITARRPPSLDTLTATSGLTYTAKCGGASPTWTPHSASWVDVQSCLTMANTAGGDRINVPAGTPTWTRMLVASYKVDLVGAGTGVTDVTLNTGTWGIDLDVTDSNVSYFTFRADGTGIPDRFLNVRGDGGTGRIHHNEFISTASSNRRCIYFSGGSNVPHPVYLVDQNTFENCRVSIAGDLSTGFGTRDWQGTPIGSPVELGQFSPGGCVYVEDNTFTYTLLQGNHTEIDTGGCIVERFSTASGTGESHVHGAGGDGAPGGRQFEFLYNDYILDNGLNYGIWVRSGSGPIIGNTFHSSYGAPLHFDIQGRAGVSAASQGCDGTFALDENNGGVNDPGHKCFNQPGTYGFASAYTIGTAVEHLVRPIPIVLNRQNGSPAPITWNSAADEDYIQDCRDLQNEKALGDFTGECGTGYGTAAEFATKTACTAGTYFWVTDEGDWNTESPALHATHGANHTEGSDGVLYECVATDTWEVRYEPYDYPHPLRAGDPDPEDPEDPPAVGGRGAQHRRLRRGAIQDNQ